MTRADWAQRHYERAADLMTHTSNDDRYRAFAVKAALWHREQARRLEGPHK